MMLTDEKKRSLYSHAESEGERQRLLTAFESDPKTDSMRGLFERVAQYVLMGAAALGVSYLSGRAIEGMSPHAPLALSLGVPLAVFLAVIVGVNIAIASEGSKQRREWLEQAGRRYGYPLTLLVGVLAGWHLQAYTAGSSREREAERAAIAACARLGSCLALATRINGGDDVSWHIAGR